MIRRAIVLSLTILLIGGCLRVGDPTPDDQTQLAAWSAVVQPKDREEVTRQAALHTDWMERKKVEWEIAQYRTRYNHEQAKAAAATRTTTQPTTQLFAPPIEPQRYPSPG